MPETFIIYRMKFEESGWTDRWWNAYCSLTDSQKEIANKVIHSNKFENIQEYRKYPQVYKVLQYYTISKDFNPEILNRTSIEEKELLKI